MLRRKIVLGGAMVTALSLLLARVHPFGDAGLYAQTPAPGSTIMEHSAVPASVRETLVTKCADCHSMQTRSPLYGRFAPVSWLMEHDIVKGREEMNLALWDTYSPDRQQTLQAKIVQQVKSRTMPLPQYRIIHRDANLTDAEIQRLIAWSRETQIPAFDGPAQTLDAGDRVRGKLVFQKRCTGCHGIEPGHEGPALQGVFGRRSASLNGFNYSDALKRANLVWDEASLERWLTDPDAFVPGNNMEFHVAKPQERRDLIAFLRGGDLTK
jgi:cytochrome c